MHILQYVKAQIIKLAQAIFMKARSWPIDSVERKFRLNLGKNSQKVASKWPQLFLNNFQFSYIMRAYISREKCDLVY